MNSSVYYVIRLVELGEFESARLLAAKELEKDSGDPYSWAALGIAQANQGDYDWAAQSFEKYLQCVEKQKRKG